MEIKYNEKKVEEKNGIKKTHVKKTEKSYTLSEVQNFIAAALAEKGKHYEENK